MNLREQTTIHRRETVLIELNADDIKRILDLPDTAKVFIRVPAGGSDWNNMTLNITNNTPLKITYDR